MGARHGVRFPQLDRSVRLHGYLRFSKKAFFLDLFMAGCARRGCASSHPPRILFGHPANLGRRTRVTKAMKLSKPVVVLRHKNQSLAKNMAALLRIEGMSCSLETWEVQQQAERRGELRLLVEAADALRTQARLAERLAHGELRRPPAPALRQGGDVKNRRPLSPPHQRSALLPYHRAERAKTASRRRGHRAQSRDDQG